MTAPPRSGHSYAFKFEVNSVFTKALLIQAPVLFAGTLGLVVVFRYWRKAPGASLWCSLGFLLALAGSLLTIYAWLAESYFVNNVVVLVLRAVTYIVFLIAVYAGRADTVVVSTQSQRTLWQPVGAMLRARPALTGMFRTVFVCTFLLVFAGSVLVSFIKPESFVGTTRVRLRMDSSNQVGINFNGALQGVLDARRLRTECEVLQSEVILGKVINDLNLGHEWGIKYGDGKRLETSDTMELLKHCIDVRPVHDSDIIQILCYSNDAKEAARIANALAESYCDYLFQWRNESSVGRAKMPVLVGEVVDRASPGLQPVLPNRKQDMVLGLWESIWWGILVGAIVVWIAVRFAKKHRTSLEQAPKGRT